MAKRSRGGADRHLILKGLTYWFRREIPEPCRPLEAASGNGGRFRLVSLQTGDLRLARPRRDALERETDRRWADMKAGRYVPSTGLSAAERGALWREELERLGLQRGAVPERLPASTPWEHLTDAERASAVAEGDPLGEALEAVEGEAERLAEVDQAHFTGALLGRLPVDHHLTAYLAELHLVSASKAERAGLIRRFAKWALAKRKSLDAVTRAVAGEYVGSLAGMHPVTRAKHLTALRGYWSFLHRRGLYAGGDKHGAPWTDMELPDRSKRIGREEAVERPFTAEEVTALLTAPWPKGRDEKHRSQVIDTLRVGLLAGMRLEEVTSLQVADVEAGVIDIKEGKTLAAARKVPIHPELVELFARRTKGKARGELIFHELAGMRDAADTCGKRFARYRKAVGVHDKADDQRRSLVNFHSARRWFTTSAVHAGCAERLVEDTIGHKASQVRGVLGAYVPGGASLAQRRQVVESVRLPAQGSPPIALKRPD